MVPSRPCVPGPVKVDNWRPKGSLAHQRNTAWVLPQTWNSCRRKNPHVVSAGDGSANGDLTLKEKKNTHTHGYLIGWRRCQHWLFHQSLRLTDSWWCWGTSTHHPTSTQLGNSFGRMDLCCFVLFWLLYVFYYFSRFFYGLVFAEALLWTFHKARMCEMLLSVQALLFFCFLNGTVCLLWFIVRALLQQGVPRDRRNV